MAPVFGESDCRGDRMKNSFINILGGTSIIQVFEYKSKCLMKCYVDTVDMPFCR